MTSHRALMVAVLVSAVIVAGCSSSTQPTQVPPPVTPDPPKITCPAPAPVQMASTATAMPVGYAAPTVVNGKLPLTTNCTPASGSSFSIGQSTAACTTTDALQRTDSCTFVVTVLPPPLLKATSFVAFGDSITFGEDGRNSASDPVGVPVRSLRFYPRVQFPAAQTYPGVLLQSLSSRYVTQTIAVDNRGAAGEAITDTDPDTLARFVGLTSSRLYSVVLIMEGSNDLQVATKDAAVLPVALARLRQMVRDAKNRSVIPYLATIPPMNPAGSRGSIYGWDLVPGFNDGIRSVAAAEGITLVDVYQGFGGDLSLLGSDGLHPNAAGYARIADTFFTAIRQTLESATPVSPSAARSIVRRSR